MKSKYLFIVFMTLLVVLLSGCGGSENTSEVVNLYTWGDYMDESLLKDFEKETGIKVVVDYFNTNEDMYVKMKQGSGTYDLVCPSDYMIERMIAEGMLQKMDYSLMPNARDLEENFFNLDYDPGNEYSVPYFWGTLGIIYDAEIITEGIDSWADLWNPKYEDLIIMQNNQRDSISVALKYLGYSMNTRDLDELNAARDALVKQKSLVYAYLGDEARDMMIAGNAPIGVVYSGDAYLMHDEVPSLTYVLPKEGSNVWYDSWVVPTDAENPEGAMLLINYLSAAENAARNAEYVYGYSTPFIGAMELLPEEYLNSPIAYPDISQLAGSEVYHDPKDVIVEYDRVWTEVLSSQE